LFKRVPEDAGLLCDKAALLVAVINVILCIFRSSLSIYIGFAKFDGVGGATTERVDI
jgi:hypothetical protein